MKIPRRDLWTGKTSIALPPATAQELSELAPLVMAGFAFAIAALFGGLWFLLTYSVWFFAPLSVMGAVLATLLAMSASNFETHTTAQAQVMTRFMREGLLPEMGVQFIREVADTGRPLTRSEAEQLIKLGQVEQVKRQRDELYAIAKSSGGNAGEQ